MYYRLLYSMKGISRFTYTLCINGDDRQGEDDISNFSLIDGYIQNHDSSCISVIKLYFESQIPGDDVYSIEIYKEGVEYKVRFGGGTEDYIHIDMRIMLYAVVLDLLYYTGNLKETFTPLISSPFYLS